MCDNPLGDIVLQLFNFHFQAGCDLNLVDYENRTPFVSTVHVRIQTY